jgi:hypothetical protein
MFNEIMIVSTESIHLKHICGEMYPKGSNQSLTQIEGEARNGNGIRTQASIDGCAVHGLTRTSEEEANPDLHRAQAVSSEAENVGVLQQLPGGNSERCESRLDSALADGVSALPQHKVV